MSVSAVATNPSFLRTVGQTLNDVAHFVFGETDIFSKALKKSVKGGASLTQGLGVAWDASRKAVEGKSFWKFMWDELKGIPADIGKALKEVAGGGLWTKTKAVGGVLWKRMPFIGNLIYVAMEIPNIYNALTSPQGGLGTAIGETLKATTRILAFTAGIAIGTAFGGPLGGMALGFGLDWVAGKIVGKSFTEKQKEAAEAQRAAQQGEQATNQAAQELAQQDPQGTIQQAAGPNQSQGTVPTQQASAQTPNPFQANDFQRQFAPQQQFGGTGENLFASNPSFRGGFDVNADIMSANLDAQLPQLLRGQGGQRGASFTGTQQTAAAGQPAANKANPLAAFMPVRA